MAEIKLADVAKLRKMTMAGMMDCKNALAEADGDMERAVEIIRERVNSWPANVPTGMQRRVS